MDLKEQIILEYQEQGWGRKLQAMYGIGCLASVPVLAINEFLYFAIPDGQTVKKCSCL
jgi:hypothetical protein